MRSPSTTVSALTPEVRMAGYVLAWISDAVTIVITPHREVIGHDDLDAVK
jgi:hypothetical protein